jgi:hypothetical protein
MAMVVRRAERLLSRYNLALHLPPSSFYVNLPIGGLAILVIIIYYKSPPHVKPVEASRWEKFLQMDIPGTALILVALVCFLLGMQWGGITRSWASAHVVVVLVFALALTVTFAVVEYVQNERSLLIPRLMKNRTTSGLCIFIFLLVVPLIYGLFKGSRTLIILHSLNGANFLFVYYIPLYFQSIHGLSPAQSGIRNIPLIVTNCKLSALAPGH